VGIGEDRTPELTTVLLFRVILFRDPFGILKEIVFSVEDEISELVYIGGSVREIPETAKLAESDLVFRKERTELVAVSVRELVVIEYPRPNLLAA